MGGVVLFGLVFYLIAASWDCELLLGAKNLGPGFVAVFLAAGVVAIYCPLIIALKWKESAGIKILLTLAIWAGVAAGAIFILLFISIFSEGLG